MKRFRTATTRITSSKGIFITCMRGIAMIMGRLRLANGDKRRRGQTPSPLFVSIVVTFGVRYLRCVSFFLFSSPGSVGAIFFPISFHSSTLLTPVVSSR